MKYYKLSNGDKSAYVILEREVPMPDRAGITYIINGIFDPHNIFLIQKLADVTAIEVGYAIHIKRQELTRSEFISEAVSRTLTYLKKFVLEIRRSGSEAFVLPSSFVEGRTLLQNLFSLNHDEVRTLIFTLLEE